LLPACGAGSGATTGGKLTYGLTLTVSGIDPHRGASSELGIFLTSVYDPLVWETPEGTFVPGLAQKWEVSDDGKVYTFHLRHDVTFHDGTKLTAEAVKVSFDRIVDPALKSQKAAGMIGPYDHTEVVDEYTARVYLKEPYAPFLDAASQVYLAIMSPTALAKWGAAYQEHQVGTGPFMMKEYVPKDHITLVRNPAYNWAPSVMKHQGAADLDEITFRFYPDPATRAAALQSGEVDVMGEVPPQDATRLQETGEFQAVPVQIPGQSLQFFLNTQKPPTDDLRVRQAILYSVDRDAIVNTVFRGFSPVAWGPLGATTPYYSSAVKGKYPYDPAKARELLTQAGYSDTNGDGVLEKDGKPATLEMILMTWGNLPEVGQMLQADLRQAGFVVNVQTLAYPAAVQAAGEGQHNLVPQALSSTDPSIMSSFFHSRNISGGFGWTRYTDPALDAALDQGAATSDPAARREDYATAQRIVMDNALILPIRDYVNLNVASKKVSGLKYAPQGWFPWLYDVQVKAP
jgi:peptide/nickel transport system substrate-binding protein